MSVFVYKRIFDDVRYDGIST